MHRYMQDSTTFFFFFIDVLIITFNCLLFIGYIQNALTVNFHSIFTIVRSSSAPITNDHHGVTTGELWPVIYDQRGSQSARGLLWKRNF